MKRFYLFFLILGLIFLQISELMAQEKISPQTQVCLSCHQVVTPGIVSDWKKSKHAKAVNNGKIIGCAECHTLDPEKHKDTFNHQGYKVHTVVTPLDCAKCHPKEAKEYSQNLMAYAHVNLVSNPIYKQLMEAVNGIYLLQEKSFKIEPPSQLSNQDSCFYCHGSKVEVKGFKTRNTVMGPMTFPEFTGWSNIGVGRLNPDDSKGSCSACHPRHSFSIEVARKPETCATCHKGKDVPAYKVYTVSRHGTTYASLKEKWNFGSKPWKLGEDYLTPTCAVCHISEVYVEGKVVAKRTHQMSDRLAHRLFGLIYATPHPKSPDTTIIKNKAGLPLPSELTGEPVKEFLIDEKEKLQRLNNMKAICLSCHSTSWVEEHFARLEEAIRTTNAMTLSATQLLLTAWQKGVANQSDGLFNEAIEKMWVETWLFYSNSVRFASAMAGVDNGVFEEGRWQLAMNLNKMYDWLKFLLTSAK
ncbi:MAG: hydroxylamine oxidase [Thermodesulfobacteriaceae bacterium]|nr:hydroxylamine oxidase [Thermodesulfobacteriaceae bacterium]